MDKNIPAHELENEMNRTMEQAHQTYGLLNEEVRRWQDERGSSWLTELSPAETPPYFPLADFPETVVLELWERLNRVLDLSVGESVLRETWHDFKVGRPVSDPRLDPRLLSTLQIALSSMANLMRTKAPLQDQPIELPSQGAVCPVCGEGVALAVLVPPNGKRFLHCILCGQEWATMRVGCIRCGNEEAKKQYYLNSEEFPGIEIVACEACGQYFKEFDLRSLSVADYVWEDVITMPLNYAAEQWLAEHAKSSGKIQ